MMNNDIHLKSEKVTNLIGTIPMRYLWIGLFTIIICLILLVVLFGIVRVPMYQEFEMKMLKPSSGYVVSSYNLELEDGHIYKATGGHCSFEKVCGKDTVFFTYKPSVIGEKYTPDSIMIRLPVKKQTFLEIIKIQSSPSSEN